MKKTFAIILCILLAISSVAISWCGKAEETRNSYKITCTLSDENQLTGTEEVVFFNSTEVSIDHLKFNLFGNAFRKDAKYKPISPQYEANSYPNGLSYGEMKVNAVRVGGKQVEFNIQGEDMNVLYVPLSKAVYPDESVTVEIDFWLKLANVVARTGYNDHTINLGNFYPILCVYDSDGFYECVYYANGDPFYSECADYSVIFTANKDYVVAGGGRKVSREVVGEKATYRFELKNARSFALVLSKEFKTITKMQDDVLVNYYYYGDKTPEKSMEYILKSLKYFSKTFGDYVYNDYSVVETAFVQGGMEYPSLVMISDSLEERAYGEVIVHETAHQWWQTAVGNNEIKYGFLDEGLTEYSVVLFYENHSEYGMKRSVMIKSCEDTYKNYCTVHDKIFGKVDTSMLRSLGEFKSEYEYVNIAYIKPCIMYDYLRKTIGDGKFFNALEKYYKNYTFKNATPDDLTGAFEKTGAGTNGFFDSFYSGKVIL